MLCGNFKLYLSKHKMLVSFGLKMGDQTKLCMQRAMIFESYKTTEKHRKASTRKFLFVTYFIIITMWMMSN